MSQVLALWLALLPTQQLVAGSHVAWYMAEYLGRITEQGSPEPVRPLPRVWESGQQEVPLM
jgi:hypothetical protein